MDGKIVIGTEIDTKSFEAQIDLLEDKLDTLTKEYEVAMKDADFPEEELLKYRKEIEQTTNKIIQLRQQQGALNSTEMPKMGQSISGIVKNIARWGLALFGIRSMYMGIRSAVGILSQDNKQLATDIEYIKWSIAKTLEPIIQRIVNFVFKVIQAINYLIYRLTGVNLLSNSMAKNFKKASGSAKEMQKTLQGFDEANILNSTSSGGGGGTTLPTEDLSKFNLLSEDLMSTLDKIADKIKNIWKIIEPYVTWFVEKPERILSVLMAIKALKFTGILGGGAGAGATGLIGILGTLGLLAADIWLIKIAADGIAEIIDEATKLKEELQELTGMTETQTDSWKKTRNAMYEHAKQSKNSKEETEKVTKAVMDNIKYAIFQRNELKKSKTFLGEFDGTNKEIQKSIDKLNETMEDDIEFLKQMYKNGDITKTEYEELSKAILDNASSLNTQENAIMEDRVQTALYEMDVKNLKDRLDNVSDTNYNVEINPSDIDNTSKKVDGITGGLKELIKKPWKITAEMQVKKENFNKLTEPLRNMGFKIPKLAKGGIINLPGSGVPVGAMAGERGKEGVIPLSDSQQMEMIGEAIGRYVTINLTNITKLNARQIAKETKKVNAENDFATNGR